MLRVSNNIQDLTGIGDEMLVDIETDNVIAKFFNGRLITGLSVETKPSVNNDQTIGALNV